MFRTDLRKSIRSGNGSTARFAASPSMLASTHRLSVMATMSVSKGSLATAM